MAQENCLRSGFAETFPHVTAPFQSLTPESTSNRNCFTTEIGMLKKEKWSSQVVLELT